MGTGFEKSCIFASNICFLNPLIMKCFYLFLFLLNGFLAFGQNNYARLEMNVSKQVCNFDKKELISETPAKLVLQEEKSPYSWARYVKVSLDDELFVRLPVFLTTADKDPTTKFNISFDIKYKEESFGLGWIYFFTNNNFIYISLHKSYEKEFDWRISCSADQMKRIIDFLNRLTIVSEFERNAENIEYKSDVERLKFFIEHPLGMYEINDNAKKIHKDLEKKGIKHDYVHYKKGGWVDHDHYRIDLRVPDIKDFTYSKKDAWHIEYYDYNKDRIQYSYYFRFENSESDGGVFVLRKFVSCLLQDLNTIAKPYYHTFKYGQEYYRFIYDSKIITIIIWENNDYSKYGHMEVCLEVTFPGHPKYNEYLKMTN